MSVDLIIVGAWCLAAATLIGWLLYRTDRWAQGRLDEHVDTALAMANARARHPAMRAKVAATPARPERQCATCGGGVAFGPISEHLCQRGLW